MLGVDEPIFLGGAGRWRDSGMEGTPPRHQQRFIDADPGESVGALVAIIRELRPHVVVTYDPAGGYGHPDHIHAHDVTMAAVAASAAADVSGRTVDRAEVLLDRAVEDRTRPPAWTSSATRLENGLGCPPRMCRSSYPDDAIDAVIDAPDQLAAKVDALRAHATQVTVAPDGRSLALSNNVALPIGALEHYMLVSGAAGVRDDRGWETDLLAGLNFQ